MGARAKARKYKSGVKNPTPVTYDPLVAFNRLKTKSS